MKKNPPLLLTILFYLLLCPFNTINAQQEPIYVGVLDLDAGNIDAEEAKIISERLRYHIGTSTLFQLFERGKMVEILTEQGFQNFTGVCDSDECVVQVGKIIGVEKMIAGSVGQVGQTFTLHVRIIDMETAEVEHQSYANTSTIDDALNSGTLSVINDLIQKLTGISAPDRPTAQRPYQAPETLTIPPDFEKIRTAVLDLDTNNVDPTEGRAITERLSLYLIRTGVFQVVSRSNVQNILDELGFQISGASKTDEVVINVGKLLGLSKIIAGSVSRVGTLYSIQVRIYDIERNTVEYAAYCDVAGFEDVLFSGCQNAAYDLAAHYVPPL